MDAFPRAPVRMNASEILVNGLVFTNSLLELTAAWDPPSILYGTEIVKYEIWLGRNHLEPYGETEQNQHNYVTTETKVSQRCNNTCMSLYVFNSKCLFLFLRIILQLAQMKYIEWIRSLVSICRQA